MKLEIGSVDKLVEYVDNQLRLLFGETNSVQPFIGKALEKSEFCFMNTNNKYSFAGERGQVLTSPFCTEHNISILSLTFCLHRRRSTTSV